MKILAIISICMAITFISMAQDIKDSLPAGWWSIPRTKARITIGGYVKFDMNHDFNPINSPSFFDVSKIPTDGSKGTNSHLQANESRVFIDFVTPAGKTELRTYVEGDFYGSGGAFRLRHAIVQVGGKLTAGQYWSNFMDETIIPPTLDFEKPAAYAFVRHGLISYKFTTSKTSYLTMALEEPLINVQAPARPGKTESFVPDLTARYRLFGSWGHAQLSAYGGFYRFRPTTGSTETTAIYGANLSGQWNFYKKDYFIYQLLGGPGVSRYRGSEFAAPDENDKLKPIPGYGIMGGIRHFWNPAWSSLVVINYGKEDNLEGQPGSAMEMPFYGAANIVWQFHKIAWAGIEYLHGIRKDKDGSEGSANRIQISIQANINKH